MRHDIETLEVAELGRVSAETKGDQGLPIEAGGFLPVTGLSDD